MLRFVLRQRRREQPPIDEIIEVEAGSQRNDETAAFARRQCADILRHRPSLVGAGVRREAMDLPPLDVDPVEALLPHVPDRPLAEERTTIERALHIHLVIPPVS
ncbi:MAG: hypothetical protein WAV38_05605 [Xanthobacteraceae bacterium]